MDRLRLKYLKETNGLFGEVIALEKMSDGFNIVQEIISFLDESPNNKFKMELLMFPSWATKNKKYKIYDNYYTHIRIKC